MSKIVYQISGTDDGQVQVKSMMPQGQFVAELHRIAFEISGSLDHTDAAALKIAFEETHLEMRRVAVLRAKLARTHRVSFAAACLNVGIAIYWLVYFVLLGHL